MELRIQTNHVSIKSISIQNNADITTLVLDNIDDSRCNNSDRCYCGDSVDRLKDLNHLSWREIKEIASSGKARDCFAIGATKIDHMTDGFDAIWRIIDFYADVDENGDLIPITWDMAICTDDEVSMNSNGSNDGRWGDSDGRAYCNWSFFNRCSKELRSIITPAVKTTALRDGTLKKTTDKIWLKSEKELFGRNIWSSPGEGRWYAYYKQEDVPYYICDKDGNRVWTWERSPISGASSSFCIVNYNGGANGNGSRYAGGLAPAFCC